MALLLFVLLQLGSGQSVSSQLAPGLNQITGDNGTWFTVGQVPAYVCTLNGQNVTSDVPICYYSTHYYVGYSFLNAFFAAIISLVLLALGYCCQRSVQNSSSRKSQVEDNQVFTAQDIDSTNSTTKTRQTRKGAVLSVSVFFFIISIMLSFTFVDDMTTDTSIGAVQRKYECIPCTGVQTVNGGLDYIPQTNQASLGSANSDSAMNISTNGVTVTITTTCGATIETFGNNVTWSTEPYYIKNCTDTNVTVLDRLETFYSRYCMGSKEQNPDFPWASGIIEQTLQQSNWPNCFFATDYTAGFVGYHGSEQSGWSDCNLENNVAAATNDCWVLRNGVCIPSSAAVTVDPMMSYPYGWAQNGSALIAFTAYDSFGLESSICMGCTVEEMARSHITGWNWDSYPSTTPIGGVQLSPAALQCWVTFSFPDNGGYTQLYNWCPTVSATLVSGSSSGIVITTTSTATCNVQIGINSTYNWTISITSYQSYKVGIATLWNCVNTGQGTGANCTQGYMTNFSTLQMNSYISAHFVNQTSANYASPSNVQIHVPSMFANNSFMNILMWLVILGVIITIIIILCYCGCCCCKKKAAQGSKVSTSDDF